MLLLLLPFVLPNSDTTVIEFISSDTDSLY